MPSTIEAAHRQYRGRGLTVLAVNMQEEKGKVAAWVRSSGVTSRVLLDGDGEVTRRYRVTATPAIYLVARDGRLVARGFGTRDWMGPGGRALLEALLGEPPR